MDGFDWNAIYSDGTNLRRFENGIENSYGDIDRGKLESFEVTHECGSNATVCFERPTQKLIYRRRCTIDFFGRPVGTVVMAGWQENIDGKSYKSIVYLYPDGHVELDGSRNDLQLFPSEE